MERYHSPSAEEHRRRGRQSVSCAVVTVSDTRTLADDRSGALIGELLEHAGHRVAARVIVPDDRDRIERTVAELAAREAIEAILLTGGTGASSRDVTYEAVAKLLTKELTGFGELFRSLSYQEIGPAAMLSRAIAGLCGPCFVAAMPGSTAGVRLAMEKLVVPELGHLVELARS